MANTPRNIKVVRALFLAIALEREYKAGIENTTINNDDKLKNSLEVE